MGKTAVYRVAIAAGTGHVSKPMESVPMAASLGTRVLIAETTVHQTVEATKVVQPRPSFVPTAASLGTRVLIAEMTVHQTVEATKVVQPRPSFVPTAVSQVLMDFSVTKLPMLQ